MGKELKRIRKQIRKICNELKLPIPTRKMMKNLCLKEMQRQIIPVEHPIYNLSENAFDVIDSSLFEGDSLNMMIDWKTLLYSRIFMAWEEGFPTDGLYWKQKNITRGILLYQSLKTVLVIIQLSVHEIYRYQGVGRALVQRLIQNLSQGQKIHVMAPPLSLLFWIKIGFVFVEPNPISKTGDVAMYYSVDGSPCVSDKTIKNIQEKAMLQKEILRTTIH